VLWATSGRYSSRNHLWFFGGLTTIKAAGDGTMVTEQTAPRGSGSPLHVHHNEDEWFYVLEGELTIWVDARPMSHQLAHSFLGRATSRTHSS